MGRDASITHRGAPRPEKKMRFRPPKVAIFLRKLSISTKPMTSMIESISRISKKGRILRLFSFFFSTGTFAHPAPFFLERNLSKFRESFDEIRWWLHRNGFAKLAISTLETLAPPKLSLENLIHAASKCSPDTASAPMSGLQYRGVELAAGPFGVRSQG